MKAAYLPILLLSFPSYGEKFLRTRPSSAAVTSQYAKVPTTSRGRMLDLANSLIGRPYVWSGKDPHGFDCSGFVYFIVNSEVGPGHYPDSKIYAITYKQILEAAGARIFDKSQLKAGDIVYFPKNLAKSNSHHHIGFITDPARDLFISAQIPRVSIGSYGPGGFWSSHEPEFYRNIWLRD